MTEAEWLSATDPEPTVEFPQGKVSERKLRRFACAIVRSEPFHRDGKPIWEVLPGFEWFQGSARNGEPINGHTLMEIAERFADGKDRSKNSNTLSEIISRGVQRRLRSQKITDPINTRSAGTIASTITPIRTERGVSGSN